MRMKRFLYFQISRWLVGWLAKNRILSTNLTWLRNPHKNLSHLVRYPTNRIGFVRVDQTFYKIQANQLFTQRTKRGNSNGSIQTRVVAVFLCRIATFVDVCQLVCRTRILTRKSTVRTSRRPLLTCFASFSDSHIWRICLPNLSVLLLMFPTLTSTIQDLFEISINGCMQICTRFVNFYMHLLSSVLVSGTCFEFPWIDNCLMVTKWNNYQDRNVTIDLIGCLSSAVGNRPSDPCLMHGGLTSCICVWCWGHGD